MSDDSVVTQATPAAPAAPAPAAPAAADPEPAPAPAPARQHDFYAGDDDPEEEAPSSPAAPAKSDPPAGEATPGGEGKQASDPQSAPAGGIDDNLLAQAEALGISREEATAFGNPDRLQTAVRVLDRQLATIGRQPQAPTPPPAPAQPKPSEPAVPAVPADFSLEIDEEVVDPAVVKSLRALEKHYGEKIKTLEARIVEDRNRGEIQERNQQLEGALSGLGADWHDVFGKEPLSEFLAKPGVERTPAFQNLNKVLGEMDALAKGYAATGRNVPSVADLLKKALPLAFGDKVNGLARSRVVQQVAGRKTQALARPTGRQGAARSPYESAVGAVDAMIKDRGLDADED